MELTHVNTRGEAHMVDVGAKQNTQREAVAQAVVTMREETLSLIVRGDAAKGDVFGCARVAGIMAAKKTSEIIPLCHPVPLDSVEIDLAATDASHVTITASVKCHYHTGVEMEALTAATAAALTIYDMCKAVDRGMTIGEIALLKKTGGKSGTYSRDGI